jgi:hypothetical protein
MFGLRDGRPVRYWHVTPYMTPLCDNSLGYRYEPGADVGDIPPAVLSEWNSLPENVRVFLCYGS